MSAFRRVLAFVSCVAGWRPLGTGERQGTPLEAQLGFLLLDFHCDKYSAPRRIAGHDPVQQQWLKNDEVFLSAALQPLEAYRLNPCQRLGAPS